MASDGVTLRRIMLTLIENNFIDRFVEYILALVCTYKKFIYILVSIDKLLLFMRALNNIHECEKEFPREIL